MTDCISELIAKQAQPSGEAVKISSKQLLITGTMGREAEAQIIEILVLIHVHVTCHPLTYMWQPTSVHVHKLTVWRTVKLFEEM